MNLKQETRNLVCIPWVFLTDCNFSNLSDIYCIWHLKYLSFLQWSVNITNLETFKVSKKIVGGHKEDSNWIVGITTLPKADKHYTKVSFKLQTTKNGSKLVSRDDTASQTIQSKLQINPTLFHHRETKQKILQLALPGSDHNPDFLRIPYRYFCPKESRSNFRNMMPTILREALGGFWLINTLWLFIIILWGDGCRL